MAEWTLKFADARGEIRQEVAEAASEGEIRDRLTQQGFLVYSIKPRSEIGGIGGLRAARKKINVEKFLIFNQQFVTLIRAGLPILKSLDLLAERLTDPKISRYIKAVREEVKSGALLSDAFGRQGVFPTIYVTSVLAGERSGSLPDVLERYVTYQKLALSVRKKLLVSLLYPAVLVSLAACLIVFLVTFVVPNFAELYKSMSAQLPAPTLFLIALGTTARNYVLVGFAAFVAGDFRVSLLVAHAVRRRKSGPHADADAHCRGGMAEIPGGPIRARAGHAAGGRHPADAGSQYGCRFAGHPGAEESAAGCGKAGARRKIAVAVLARYQDLSRRFRST